MSAFSPENTLGGHIWGKRDILGEEHEENIPNALGGLRLLNYNKQKLGGLKEVTSSCQGNPMLLHGVPGQRRDLLRTHKVSCSSLRKESRGLSQPQRGAEFNVGLCPTRGMAGGAEGPLASRPRARVCSGRVSGCTAFGLTACSRATLEDVPGDSQVTQSDLWRPRRGKRRRPCTGGLRTQQRGKA